MKGKYELEKNSGNKKQYSSYLHDSVIYRF